MCFYVITVQQCFKQYSSKADSAVGVDHNFQDTAVCVKAVESSGNMAQTQEKVLEGKVWLFCCVLFYISYALPLHKRQPSFLCKLFSMYLSNVLNKFDTLFPPTAFSKQTAGNKYIHLHFLYPVFVHAPPARVVNLRCSLIVNHFFCMHYPLLVQAWLL